MFTVVSICVKFTFFFLFFCGRSNFAQNNGQSMLSLGFRNSKVVYFKKSTRYNGYSLGCELEESLKSLAKQLQVIRGRLGLLISRICDTRSGRWRRPPAPLRSLAASAPLLPCPARSCPLFPASPGSSRNEEKPYLKTLIRLAAKYPFRVNEDESSKFFRS